jgi:hypothetical protein
MFRIVFENITLSIRHSTCLSALMSLNLFPMRGLCAHLRLCVSVRLKVRDQMYCMLQVMVISRTILPELY